MENENVIQESEFARQMRYQFENGICKAMQEREKEKEEQRKRVLAEDARQAKIKNRKRIFKKAAVIVGVVVLSIGILFGAAKYGIFAKYKNIIHITKFI